LRLWRLQTAHRRGDQRTAGDHPDAGAGHPPYPQDLRLQGLRSGADHCRNRAENAIRPFVIGRKNWLFSDTPKGATTSAQIYSLIETAKANGQEPYAWLRHILERLPTAQSVEDYEALLPWNCAPASAPAS
jgi:hypothetical protein